MEADVLLAPAQFEPEPTRQLLSEVIKMELLPEYAKLMQSFPIPTIELTALELPQFSELELIQTSVRGVDNALSVSGNLRLR